MRTFLYGLTAALLLTLVCQAFSKTPTVRVRFKKGATSATVKGRVKGYQTVDYLIGARKGQRMKLTLTSTKDRGHFIIHSVDGMETQAIEMTELDEVLAESGDYRIRVGMTRAIARRKGAVADYALKVEIVD